MADHQNEQNHKPILYKVEPEDGEQISSQKGQEVLEEPREAEHSNKEEKIEQLKHEFGVYEALAEVEREKAVANEWTQAYRKQEHVEQQEPIQQPQKQQVVLVQHESSPEKVAPKKRKKKKQESVAEVITRLISAKGSPATCQAKLFGEKTNFQVLSMRGDIVKIRMGYRIRYIKLSDISQLKVISGE